MVPYDPSWPRRFEQERAVLRGVLAGSEAAIEHVASTAVPGLGAKPVIDIMVGLSHLAEAEDRIASLEAASYEYVRKHERQFPERRYFRKARLGRSAYHLHCASKEAIAGFVSSPFAIIFVLIRNLPRTRNHRNRLLFAG